MILLDGLDELLQASDHDRRAYLREVPEFQRTEAAVGRDVIVIVTSRVVVADRLDIPPGTTVMKLDPFSDEDIADWLAGGMNRTPRRLQWSVPRAGRPRRLCGTRTWPGSRCCS